MIYLFRKALLAVALIAGLSASAAMSIQVADEASHIYARFEA